MKTKGLKLEFHHPDIPIDKKRLKKVVVDGYVARSLLNADAKPLDCPKELEETVKFLREEKLFQLRYAVVLAERCCRYAAEHGISVIGMDGFLPIGRD